MISNIFERHRETEFEVKLKVGKKMIIKKITIEGLRGFSEKREISFAIPDKVNKGSGLTVLVGPNNSGKSTIIEAFHILNSANNSIQKNSRNILNDRKVKIEAIDITDNKIIAQTTENGGSYIERKFNEQILEGWQNKLEAFILSNKRNFSSTFGNSMEQTRENYKGNSGDDSYRNDLNINQNFGGRLIKIYKSNLKEFNECLGKVLSPIPKWTIESTNESQMYLEFSFGKTDHSSQGAGDGYINIFNIVDALYDSTENNIILIDEPEVSLHPDLQRKLFKLLLEYSKDKQIIISTHSPYFVDWKMFSSHSKIIRFKKEKEKINYYELSDKSKENIRKILKDTSNLHTLSLNTNEIFFLNDNIILTEGQEDVYGYNKIFESKFFYPNASFFGWGLGGAPKAKMILKMLQDLGYKKVFTILDNDRKGDIKELKEEYPQYSYFAISADDIRNKERNSNANNLINEIEKIDFDENIKEKIINLVKEKFPAKEGILIKLNDNKINTKYEDTINELIEKIKDYFKNSEGLEENPKEKDTLDKLPENQDDQKAQKILDDYIMKNPPHIRIEKKYDYVKFNSGSGGSISIKKISKKIYYAIYEEKQCLSERYYIIIQYHFTINIEAEKVTLRKEKTIENTIPRKYKKGANQSM